ncbi:proliferating cell nuclear antigen [Gigaspora margarita]|uniref:Proliferating cell nuclear antigen n=1 Tax=Gigaspora margarita TaxID=4874 RepID=A0A8H3X4S7_GIGMA|nr:proliferating cell nuclear antigen [Gigaspora margarita]
MRNMYNIILRPEDDEWKLKEEDTLALKYLKHTKHQVLLCHFLEFDIMTPGRDSGQGL